MLLLGPGEPPPFELLNPESRAPLLLACDHASRRVPAALGRLGLEGAAFELHIAYDIGAEEVARLLSARLGASALLAGYSRLVIDLNRGLDQPSLIAEISDGVPIPGNCRLDPAARAARIQALYWPWHRMVAAELQRLDRQSGARAALIGVHSFTPEMDGFVRPWEIGVLWDDPCQLARPLMAALAGQGLCVGDNEPYTAREPSGGTLESHALETGRPGLSVEIRQDLITNAVGQAEWAERLACVLECLLCQT